MSAGMCEGALHTMRPARNGRTHHAVGVLAEELLVGVLELVVAERLGEDDHAAGGAGHVAHL